jgi:decaprenylphospho-beta-D-ribofuranose 2-oxidase
VPLRDLFSLHPAFIPPVIPGTIHVTVAGAIAHDVHGKNNHREGSFGRHVLWLELLIGAKKIRCSHEEHSDLFHATIAGLGLTGVITQVAVRMKRASRFVLAQHQQFTSLKALTDAMSDYGLKHEYQVAWLDLLNKPRSVLSVADHCDAFTHKEHKVHSVPKVPFCLLRSWNMKLFNQLFFNTRKTQEKLSLQQFNNPLDKLMHWNRLYGPKGLIQFQAVFAQDKITETLEQLTQLISTHKAIPTLAVLKLFTKSGDGLLSFCKQGFTLAVDFIHNEQAKQVITAMNQLISDINGRIYLAKDWVLNEEQYKKMYANHEQFSQILRQHGCNMQSDLAKRLGILK